MDNYELLDGESEFDEFDANQEFFLCVVFEPEDFAPEEYAKRDWN